MSIPHVTESFRVTEPRPQGSGRQNSKKVGYLMLRMLSRVLIVVMPLASSVFAQSWEVGASGGYGLYNQSNVSSGSVSGSAGFASGLAAGALIGNEMGHWIGGEARYTLRIDDLQVSSGSTKAKATAQSHALHYDVLLHLASKESTVRPFFAVGAGVKFYRGTGAEPSFQPLSNLVVLTHTSEAQPLISLGGGVKFAVSRRMLVRLDARDYATPTPSSLLATPPGSKLSGWTHDIVFLVGVSTIF